MFGWDSFDCRRNGEKKDGERVWGGMSEDESVEKLLAGEG